MVGDKILNLQKFFREIFGQRKTLEPREPQIHRAGYTGRTQAGIWVTPDRALMSGTVFAAKRYLTQAAAQMPARVKGPSPEGEILIPNTDAEYLLNVQPNPECSPGVFREQMVGWALMYGNGVAEIERAQNGRPLNLWPIHPDRVQFKRDTVTRELIYEIDNGVDGKQELGTEDVFHIQGACSDGPVGVSVIEYAAQTIGWARATELFGASFFGEGLHFGGAVILKNKSDEDTRDRIREDLDLMYRGPTRSGRWFIGDDDMKIEKLTSTPNDSQFIQALQHQVEELCRWMGVPPHKVYHLLRMTFNNVEQLSIDVVGDSVVPWAIRLEQEATRKLLGQNRRNLKVKFEVKGLLRGSFKERQEGLQIARRNGVINADQWADMEDMPRPGKEVGGDFYIVEKNMVKLEDVGVEDKSLGLSPIEETLPPSPEAFNYLAETASILDLIHEDTTV